MRLKSKLSREIDDFGRTIEVVEIELAFGIIDFYLVDGLVGHLFQEISRNFFMTKVKIKTND